MAKLAHFVFTTHHSNDHNSDTTCIRLKCKQSPLLRRPWIQPGFKLFPPVVKKKQKQQQNKYKQTNKNTHTHTHTHTPRGVVVVVVCGCVLGRVGVCVGVCSEFTDTRSGIRNKPAHRTLILTCQNSRSITKEKIVDTSIPKKRTIKPLRRQHCVFSSQAMVYCYLELKLRCLTIWQTWNCFIRVK